MSGQAGRAAIGSYPPPDKRRGYQGPEAAASLKVKGDLPATKWTGTLPDKYIAALVELVSQQNLQASVDSLSAFHTRHSLSVALDQVVNWLVARFQSMGYADVALHQYALSGSNLKNVVCTKPGTSGRVVLICGHYDCVMQNHDDATARAPGADDNASGIAAILEMARVLHAVTLTDTIQFVAFSGEEQGLKGASAYATKLASEGVNLHRVINLDMIGFPPADGSVTVERDLGNVVATNDQASKDFGAVMAQAAADYTSLPVMLGGIYASDYMPFEAAGFVVIGAYEGEGNPHYHHDSDAANTLSYGYLTEVTRMTLATLLKATLGPVDEPGSGIDLFIRDNPTDTGNQPSVSPHWTSPDIWVRNNPPPGDNPDLGHEPPINNVPNFLYVMVHNRGTQPAPASSVSVEVFRCDPGTGMVWPDHFVPLGALPVTDPIPPAGSATVGPFIWTPHIVGHECLLAVASSDGDHAIPDVYSGSLNHGLLVRFDNNVGQRNVSPQMSVPGGKTSVPIVLRGGVQPTDNTLRIDVSALPSDSRIELRIGKGIADAAHQISGFAGRDDNSVWARLRLAGGAVGLIGTFPLAADARTAATLTVDFSQQAEHLKVYPIVVSQEQDGRSAGKLTVEITAVKEPEDFVFGNRRSGEMHVASCPYWSRMRPRNMIPFPDPGYGLARGFQGCAYCLPAHDSG